MQAKELRIGNLFTTVVPVSGSWYEKQRYEKDILIATKETFWQWDEKNFKGIPLTPEWLGRAGFEEWSEGNWKIKPEFIFSRSFK